MNQEYSHITARIAPVKPLKRPRADLVLTRPSTGRAALARWLSK
jgi:hypothetical protein